LFDTNSRLQKNLNLEKNLVFSQRSTAQTSSNSFSDDQFDWRQKIAGALGISQKRISPKNKVLSKYATMTVSKGFIREIKLHYYFSSQPF
jgi:hypothetical protein